MSRTAKEQQLNCPSSNSATRPHRPSKAPLSILKNDEISAVATLSNLALIIWKTDIDDNGMMAAWQAGEYIRGRGEKPINLVIFEPTVRVDSAGLKRKRLLTQTMMRSAPTYSSEALIFPEEARIACGLRQAHGEVFGQRHFGKRRSFGDIDAAVHWTVEVNALSKELLAELYDGLLNLQGEHTGVRLKLTGLAKP